MESKNMFEEIYKAAIEDKDYRVALEAAVLVKNEELAADCQNS